MRLLTVGQLPLVQCFVCLFFHDYEILMLLSITLCQINPNPNLPPIKKIKCHRLRSAYIITFIWKSLYYCVCFRGGRRRWGPWCHVWDWCPTTPRRCRSFWVPMLEMLKRSMCRSCTNIVITDTGGCWRRPGSWGCPHMTRTSFRHQHALVPSFLSSWSKTRPGTNGSRLKLFRHTTGKDDWANHTCRRACTRVPKTVPQWLAKTPMACNASSVRSTTNGSDEASLREECAPKN